ncbi:hypothetical protein X975_17885, partial [Stegodyphus mimosarum]
MSGFLCQQMLTIWNFLLQNNLPHQGKEENKPHHYLK